MKALENLQRDYSRDIETLYQLLEDYSIVVEELSKQVSGLETELRNYMNQIDTLSGVLSGRLSK
jgi:archaellum component FlaC